MANKYEITKDDAFHMASSDEDITDSENEELVPIKVQTVKAKTGKKREINIKSDDEEETPKSKKKPLPGKPKARVNRKPEPKLTNSDAMDDLVNSDEEPTQVATLKVETEVESDLDDGEAFSDHETESDLCETDDEDSIPASELAKPKPAPKAKEVNKPKVSTKLDVIEDSDEEVKVVKPRAPRKKAPAKEDLVDEEDREPQAEEVKVVKPRAPRKKAPAKEDLVDSDSEPQAGSSGDGFCEAVETTDSFSVGKCVLFPNQVECFKNSQRVLNSWSCVLNTSPLGSGKTYMTMALAMWLNVKLMIVGPKQTRGVWNKVCADMGCKDRVASFMTYAMLSGMRNAQPKHAFLSRIDNYGKGTVYSVTPAFKKLVSDGVLLVFDEIHAGKNNSTYHASVKALTQEVHRQYVKKPDLNANRSRCVLITGSPYEKKEMTSRYVQMLCFAESERDYIPGDDPRSVVSQLIHECKQLDTDATEKTLAECPLAGRANVHDVMYNLYLNIVKPNVVVSMDQFKLKHTPDVKNGLYEVPANEAVCITKHIEHMEDIDNNKDGEHGNQIKKRAALMTILELVEQAKLRIFAREAADVLENKPGEKVAIFLGFNHNIIKLCQMLQRYNPVCVTGLSPREADREDAVHRFQTKDKYNLIICNKKSGGSSISLHGPETRHQFISPAFDVLEQYQSSGRCIRQGDTGKVILRYVYADIGQKETRIIDNITRKTKVMGELLSEQRNSGLLLPTNLDSVKVPLKECTLDFKYDSAKDSKWISAMIVKYEKGQEKKQEKKNAQVK